jgi:hypothetical protein
LRPFTGLPRTKLSGLVAGGIYSERNEGGSASKWNFDACVDVIEHQGASASLVSVDRTAVKKGWANLFPEEASLDE